MAEISTDVYKKLNETQKARYDDLEKRMKVMNDSMKAVTQGNCKPEANLAELMSMLDNSWTGHARWCVNTLTQSPDDTDIKSLQALVEQTEAYGGLVLMYQNEFKNDFETKDAEANLTEEDKQEVLQGLNIVQEHNTQASVNLREAWESAASSLARKRRVRCGALTTVGGVGSVLVLLLAVFLKICWIILRF